MTTGPRIVVIGAGVGGLAASALLARGGARVTLLEKEPIVGGRAGLLTIDGYTWDTGPSWYLMREAFDQFYALMGTSVAEQLDLIELDPRYRVYFEGDEPDGPAEKLDVVADAEANFELFESLSPGDGAAMRAYATEAGELYRLALERFLYTTFERIDRVPNAEVFKSLPSLASLLTRPLGTKIAKRVRDPRLRQLLGFHAVFLGSSPRRAPSLFSLMSHLDLTDGVRFPKGGLYEVIRSIERLALAEGVEIRTNAEVARIEVSADDLAEAVVLANGEYIPADAVVSGADMHHTETKLLDRAHQWQPEERWAKRAPGVSALLVFAGVRGELPELEHHTLFFTRDWDSNFASIVGDGTLKPPFPASVYVSRVTAHQADAAPEGHEALVMLVPFPADPELGAGEASRAQLMEYAHRYLAQVGAWAGIEGFAERTTVYDIKTPADFATGLNTWKGSALGLEHTLRQSAMFRPGNASRVVPNLLYVGSSTVPGIGMPICLISAELVAKRMLGATSVGPLPTPAPKGFLARSVRGDLLGRIARGEGANAARGDGGRRGLGGVRGRTGSPSVEGDATTGDLE